MIKTLPEFPDFRPFTIDDITWYYDYYIEQGLNPYVDIHPENLFVWLNMNNDLTICKLNNIVVIRYTNVLNKDQVNIIPINRSLTDSSIKKIMLYLKKNGLPLEICEIPSVMCGKLNNNDWQIEDDRDSFEYILDTSQQSSLRGRKFSRQRNSINYFELEYSNDSIDVQYYEKVNNDIKKAFLNHISTMPLNSNIELSKKNLLEPIAIKKNLEYSSIFHKKFIIIKINKKIVSLGMFSKLDNNTITFNHLKVDYSIRHIFQYSLYQLAKILGKDSINEINMEQDLGVKGLRAYKLLMRPSRFLEKKIIRARHQ